MPGPNSSQLNAYNAAQSTGAGVLKDALGNVIGTGIQMPQGAVSGYVLTSDASGNLTLQAKSTIAAPAAFQPSNPGSTSSATLVMMGLGSTCAYTPASSGKVLVNVTFCFATATAAVNMTAAGRYGTGTAPTNGNAVTGTRFGGAADPLLRFSSLSGAGTLPAAFTDILALTPGTAYWFDLAVSTSNVSDAAAVSNVSMTLVELS